MGTITMISTIYRSSSWIIILLSVYASVSGIFNPRIYAKETANWALQAIGQDIGNILASLVFALCLFKLRRGAYKAFAVWIGALFYFVYAFLIYAFFVHFNELFLIYVGILGLSFYTLFGALSEIDTKILSQKLTSTRRGPAAYTLMCTGVLFGIVWLAEVIPALLVGEIPGSAATAGLWVNPIQVIDLSIVLPALILTGLFLRRKQTFGYIYAAPWLTFSSLMGSSIVANLVLELGRGNSHALPPVIFVSALVGCSIFSLMHYMSGIKEKI